MWKLKNQKKQDINKIKEEEVQQMIIEHEWLIPRQQAVVRPSQKGVTMSIDPYEDVEIYEMDIEDKNSGSNHID